MFFSLSYKRRTFLQILVVLYFNPSVSSHDGHSSRDCEIFTESGFQGSSLIALQNSERIYDLSLSRNKESQNSTSTTTSDVKSIRIHHDCGLLLCSLPKFKGQCEEYFVSEENVTEKLVEFKSALCKCSSLVEKSKTESYEKDGSVCAVLYKDWHFSGRFQEIRFAGGSGRLDLREVKSANVRTNCTLILWNELTKENKQFSLNVDNSTSLLKTANDGQYEWYCCHCNDESSEQVCKSAKESTLLNEQKESNTDFSEFVKYGKKIIGIGRNYRWKKSELTKVLKEPEEPIVFLKPSTSYIEEGQNIELPESLGTIFYEIELGVVMGKRGKLISKSTALDYVAGYFLALDMTAKEFLKKSVSQSRPWEIGKGFDTACPVSHFIPKNLIPNPNDIHLECKVNGNVTQSENTSQMIFDVPMLIAYISRYMTLEPYDVILTGTPDGLGPIQSGDLIEGKLGNLTTIRFKTITVKDGSD